MRRRFTGGPPVIKKFSARAGPRRIPDSAELGAMHVVMKSGAILPQGPQHKDFYKTVNLLLTCSAELGSCCCGSRQSGRKAAVAGRRRGGTRSSVAVVEAFFTFR